MMKSVAYEPDAHFQLVSDYYKELFKVKQYHFWTTGRWEYMHYHCYFHEEDLSAYHQRMMLWFDEDVLVGLLNFELSLFQVMISTKPAYEDLYPEIIEKALENFMPIKPDNRPLIVYGHKENRSLKSALKNLGFVHHEPYDEVLMKLAPEKMAKVQLPADFELLNLSQENELKKIHRVLYRGFGHQGEPDDDLTCREMMLSAPHFYPALQHVVKTPDGLYGAYGGMHYDEDLNIAYVEPVATDPDYRRLGLGGAVVLGGARKAFERGAKEVLVYSSLPFYKALGFTPVATLEAWTYENK